jgi:hypothetical protein
MLGMIREVLPMALTAAANVSLDHKTALSAAADKCVSSPNLTAVIEAVQVTRAAKQSATWSTGATAEKSRVFALSLEPAKRAEAAAARTMRAARIGEQMVLEAARIGEQMVLEAVRAVEETAWAVAEGQAADRATARAADASGTLMTDAMWTAEAAKVRESCDNVLRSAVQVALRAYEQTAEQQ